MFNNRIVPKSKPVVQYHRNQYAGVMGKKDGALERRFVRPNNVVQLQPPPPPPPLRFRQPNPLPTKVIVLPPPRLRINKEARSFGVDTKASLISRAGRPKGTNSYFSLPGLSTGYKSVLKSLEGFHGALENVLTGDYEGLKEKLRALDTAAELVEKKAEKYMAGSKHTRKAEVGKVLAQAKAERKMIASVFEQISEGKMLPNIGSRTFIDLARGGVPLEEMHGYIRFSKDDVNAMMADGGSKLPLNKVEQYNQAGFTYSEAVLLEQSGLGLEGGRLYRDYDMPIVPSTLVKNFDIDAIEDRYFEEFGQGGINKVYEGHFKTGDGVISGIMKPLKYPDRTQRSAVDDGTVLRIVGVNVFNPQVGLRNVVVCDIAKKLEFDVVPHTEIGVFKDQNDVNRLGVVMTKGEGRPGAKCSSEMLSDPGFRREVTKLQLLDHIVGQGDRHGNNYAVSFNDGRAVVTGYDNDQCLGRLTQHPDEVAYKPGSAYRGVKLPGVVDREMANAIRNLSFDDFELSLKGLTGPEINAAKSRLYVVKEHIETLAKEGKIIEPDQWGSSKVDENMNKENSYFARDLHYRQEGWFE